MSRCSPRALGGLQSHEKPRVDPRRIHWECGLRGAWGASGNRVSCASGACAQDMTTHPGHRRGREEPPGEEARREAAGLHDEPPLASGSNWYGPRGPPTGGAGRCRPSEAGTHPSNPRGRGRLPCRLGNAPPGRSAQARLARAIEDLLPGPQTASARLLRRTRKHVSLSFVVVRRRRGDVVVGPAALRRRGAGHKAGQPGASTSPAGGRSTTCGRRATTLLRAPSRQPADTPEPIPAAGANLLLALGTTRKGRMTPSPAAATDPPGSCGGVQRRSPPQRDPTSAPSAEVVKQLRCRFFL